MPVGMPMQARGVLQRAPVAPPRSPSTAACSTSYTVPPTAAVHPASPQQLQTGQQQRRQQRQRWRCAAADGDEAAPAPPAPTGPRDDDVLPDSLTGALRDASSATCLALDSGVERCVVEVLLSDFWDPLSGPVYAEEGDQQRFWKLTRRFLDELAGARPGAALRAVYPDAGVAAMLKNQWPDAPFAFASLNDRSPVAAGDEIVVLAAPDPPGLQDVIRITNSLSPGQSIVLFNPRLASGDVGVGLSIRRMRETFLGTFTTTYSLRPIVDVGTVFRRFPGQWQVFVQDTELAGRYRLVAERSSRPGGEGLDEILVAALGGGVVGEDGTAPEPALADKIGMTINSLQRFMRSLSQ